MPDEDLRAYSEIVIDHFQHPRNAGVLDDANAVGEDRNPVCGDRTVLTIRVRDDRIAAARFRAMGCPAAIAASSITTELLIGRTVAEALRLTNEDVSAALGGLPANKLHCSVLAEDVVRAAVEDYRQRTSAAAEVGQ